MSDGENKQEIFFSKKINKCSGFSLAELLIALAISGILLAAVAVAFNASVANYRENEDIFKTINSARQALFRITTELRTADSVDPDAPANECSMIKASNENITYRFNSGDGKLYLITNDDTTDDDYVLCDNVKAMTFTKDTAVEDSLIIVKSVQISMTVANDNITKTISAAAVVRRNLN
jgi:prepilin-type N-terminal cleavage/methylation domain-containing protein